MCHLQAPQTVGHEQEQDGVVPPALGGAAVDRLQHSADLVPGNGPGNIGEAILLRPFDSAAQIAGGHSLPMEVAKEHPKGAAQRCEGRRAAAPARGAHLGDIPTQHRGGEILQVQQADAGEVAFQCPQVVSILVYCGFTETALLTQVAEKAGSLSSEGILDPASTADTAVL